MCRSDRPSAGGRVYAGKRPRSEDTEKFPAVKIVVAQLLPFRLTVHAMFPFLHLSTGEFCFSILLPDHHEHYLETRYGVKI